MVGVSNHRPRFSIDGFRTPIVDQKTAGDTDGNPWKLRYGLGHHNGGAIPVDATLLQGFLAQVQRRWIQIP